MPSSHPEPKRYVDGKIVDPPKLRRVRVTSKGAYKIKEGTLHKQMDRYRHNNEWWLRTLYEGREYRVPEIFFDPPPGDDEN